MTNPKYATPHHRKAKATLTLEIQAGRGWCVQGLHGSSGTCLMDSRYIPPTTRTNEWHVAHNDNGDRIIGAAHALCNTTDGGQRRHTRVVKRLIL